MRHQKELIPVRNKNKFTQLFSFTWLKRGIILRALICWAVGVTTFYFTQTNSYDQRLKLRNVQETDSRIVIVDFDDQQWLSLLKSNNIPTPNTSFFLSRSDSYYFVPQILSTALESILKDEPMIIGINILFSDITEIKLKPKILKIFNHKKNIWAANIDSINTPRIPFFVDPVSQQQGLITHQVSDDGFTRFSPYHTYPLAHISELISEPLRSLKTTHKNASFFTINYAGPDMTYKRVSIADVYSNKLPHGFFKGKIVLLGTHDVRHNVLLTPLGMMDSVEVIANTIDSIINGKIINHIKPFTYFAFLFLLLIFCIIITMNYPQEMAIIILLGTSVAITAISLWLFDSHFFWTPIASPLVQIACTFILFISFQLTLVENQTWRLEQEKKYLFEVKQLKDNFVSLISHDLKTPIAKIQAIIDRVINENESSPFHRDLIHLRQESVELHRYIQSILKILKVESHDFKLNKSSTDINKIIKTVIKQLQPLADSKSVTLISDLEPLFLIDVDTVLIQEVILNLIENAIKYISKDGVVKILSSELDDRVIVVVEDSGEGISKEEQSKIFEKFHRGKKHSFQTKGSGLGLYLVKYFIELHGGDVFLESNLGQGTTVGFTLPLQSPENELLTQSKGYTHAGEH